MAKANQQFRSYTVKDPSRLDALIQADLTALDGWKIAHIEVQTQPLYTFAWVVYELV